MHLEPSRGSLVDVPGLEIGHHTLRRRLSGCSVVLARAGAVAAVDVRGASVGKLFGPEHTIKGGIGHASVRVGPLGGGGHGGLQHGG